MTSLLVAFVIVTIAAVVVTVAVRLFDLFQIKLIIVVNVWLHSLKGVQPTTLGATILSCGSKQIIV
jgi:hypothetical protein